MVGIYAKNNGKQCAISSCMKLVTHRRNKETLEVVAVCVSS